MTQPFIKNHQYNFIKKQVRLLQQALRSVNDKVVLESIQYSVQSKIIDLFPEANEAQLRMLEKVSNLDKSEDFGSFLSVLEAYLIPFPSITTKQIEKLFPKNKKLKLPNLAELDLRFVTYLNWVDAATGKLYMIYPSEGRFIGVESKYTPANKKSYCFLCNRFEELAFFSAISRKRPVNASPDYYKAVGNYLCLNGQACNHNITDVSALERFVWSVTM